MSTGSLKSVLTYDNKKCNFVIMIRTQISLSDTEYRLAKKEAKKIGVSLAEFFRRALSLVLPAKQDKPWMRHIGFVESGDPKSSQKIDEVIYGHKE